MDVDNDDVRAAQRGLVDSPQKGSDVGNRADQGTPTADVGNQIAAGKEPAPPKDQNSNGSAVQNAVGRPNTLPPAPAPAPPRYVRNTRLFVSLSTGPDSRVVLLQECIIMRPTGPFWVLFERIISAWDLRDQQARFKILTVSFDTAHSPVQPLSLQIRRDNLGDHRMLLELIRKWGGWAEGNDRHCYLSVVLQL